MLPARYNDEKKMIFFNIYIYIYFLKQYRHLLSEHFCICPFDRIDIVSSTNVLKCLLGTNLKIKHVNTHLYI